MSPTYSPTFGFHDSMRERYAAKDWDDRVVVQSNSPGRVGEKKVESAISCLRNCLHIRRARTNQKVFAVRCRDIILGADERSVAGVLGRRIVKSASLVSDRLRNRGKLLTPWSVTMLIPGTCKPWDLALVVSARQTSALDRPFRRDTPLRLTIVEPVGTWQDRSFDVSYS